MRFLSLVCFLFCFPVNLYAQAPPVTGPARALVITQPNSTGQGFYEGTLKQILGNLTFHMGNNYDVVKASGTRTEFARTGVQSWNFDGTRGTHTTSYDLVIHAGIYRSSTPCNAGYCWDSLLKAVKWPTVPQLFIFIGDAPSGKSTDGSGPCGSCSTGVASNLGCCDANLFGQAYYSVGQPEVWRASGIHMMVANAVTKPAGIWRPLVGIGSFRTGAPYVCTDCDAIVRKERPDTVAIWARYRSSIEPAPLIFCNYANGVGSATDMSLISTALAVADSNVAAFRGKRVIVNPAEIAIVIDKWGGTGRYNTFSSTDTTMIGAFCASQDSCDKNNIKAFIDSTKTLRDGKGIPLTFAVDLDSLDRYDWMRTSMESLGLNFRVTPQIFKGTTHGPLGAGNATRSIPQDIWGHNRTRTNLPIGFIGDKNTSCTETDSTILCLAKAAFDALQNRYPGKVDKIINAPLNDWSPRFLDRSNALLLNEFMTAAWYAGVRGFRVQGIEAIADPAQATPTQAPIGYGSSYQQIRVDDIDGRVLGYMQILPARTGDLKGSDPWYSQGHDIRSEFLTGMYLGIWYLPGELMYSNRHNFYQGNLKIFAINTSALGGSGDGVRPGRPGWWAIKYLVNSFEAANKFAGREVMKLTFPGEL